MSPREGEKPQEIETQACARGWLIHLLSRKPIEAEKDSVFNYP